MLGNPTPHASLVIQLCHIFRQLSPTKTYMPLLGIGRRDARATACSFGSGVCCGRTTMTKTPLLPSTCRELCKCNVVSAALP